MIAKDRYNCIIVDDDELDRITVAAYVHKYPFLNIKGIFDSAEKALQAIENDEIDVVFSDIDMPGLNGTAFRRKIMQVPVCIFITLYPDYATEGFDLAVLDFLVKPIKADRFDASMKRCKDFLDLKHKAELFEYSLGGDAVFIKDGHNHIKISLHQVLYLEALKDYTILVTSNKNYCVLSPISTLLREKSFQSFIRIHRSYAVQKHFISSLSAQQVTIDKIKLPVGRSYKEGLEAIRI